MSDTSSRFVNVDSARVAYRVQGQGPAVILVNGTAALDVHWGPVIGELSKNRTVVSLDYSGSGDTVDDGSALTLQKLANQVRAVAGASGVDRFDVIGHSLGASVAVELAATSPDLVRSLILVAGFPWGAEPRLRLEFELWLDLLRTNRTAFLRLLLLTGLTPAFISKLGVSAVEEMITGYTQFANWEGIERQVALDLVADIRDQSRMVTCPTLIISCAHDQIVTSTRGARNQHSRIGLQGNQCRAPRVLRRCPRISRGNRSVLERRAQMKSDALSISAKTGPRPRSKVSKPLEGVLEAFGAQERQLGAEASLRARSRTPAQSGLAPFSRGASLPRISPPRRA